MALRSTDTETDSASFTALLKRLGTETSELVRAEIALAKLEFREIGRQAAVDGAKIGAAIALAFVGGLALLTWAILGIGDLLGGRYGIAALGVGIVLLASGALLARSGVRGMNRRAGPKQTADAVKDTGRWMVNEARELTRGDGTHE